MRIPPVKVYFPEEDKARIIENVKTVLDSGRLTLGEYTKDLEQKFAEKHGVSYAIATHSGTSALEICLRILNRDNGEVICPTNTFFATPAAVLHAGGSVRFIDIEGKYLSLDPNLLQENISKETKIVVIVHIGGIISPYVSEIRKICDDNGITLIEDAAHAHGSHLSNEYPGSFGVAATLSFYPTKVVTAGEGGIILTNSDHINEEARIYRDQGKSSFSNNFHVKLGYNWRLPEINAVLGLSQADQLDTFIQARQRIAKIYDTELRGVSYLQPIYLPDDIFCNYYKYIVILDKKIDRDEFKKNLQQKYGIYLSGGVYDTPCHLQPIFRELVGSNDDFPVAARFCRTHICLPIFPSMTNTEVLYVVESLKKELDT